MQSWKKQTPDSTDPWNTAPLRMICSGTVHAQLQHKGRQPGLLSCLSFNWSDKPARPRYFRDGTVLLSIARHWVGKACVRSPPPRANAPATPAVPGLDSAWEGSANHCRLCQTRGLCDMGRCLQRTRARPNQHLLWPKPERNPESKSTLQCKCRQTQPNSPTHTPHVLKQQGRQGHFVEWEKLWLGFGSLLRRSLS